MHISIIMIRKLLKYQYVKIGQEEKMICICICVHQNRRRKHTDMVNISNTVNIYKIYIYIYCQGMVSYIFMQKSYKENSL